MANYMAIKKILQALPKVAGSSGRFTLSKAQLEFITKQAGKDGRLFEKVLTSMDVKEPAVDIAYKAKSNYAVAGIRFRDGKKVVSQSAFSIINPGEANSVVKFRASVGENGKIASAHGFLDGGQTANPNDIALSISRKDGVVTTDISTGKFLSLHAVTDEKAAADRAKEIGIDTRKTTILDEKLGKSLNNITLKARELLKGNVAKV